MSTFGKELMSTRLGLNVLIGVGLLGGVFVAGRYFSKMMVEKPTASALDTILVVAALVVLVSVIVAATRIIVAGISERQVTIPEMDREMLVPLIANADEKAIDQYVRLSSLTGAAGLATKLGLMGLPLLTVALTLIFAGLSLYSSDKGFMDLTKLTLGAFIGSFVQRAATSQEVATDAVKKMAATMSKKERIETAAPVHPRSRRAPAASQEATSQR